MSHAFASPLVAGDEDDLVESKNRRFFASPSADRKHTMVFRRAKPKNQLLWRMAGWNNVAFLSDDGELLTVGYFGGDLLTRADRRKEVEMLTSYRRGVRGQSITLGQIIKAPEALACMGENCRWGQFRGYVALHRVGVHTVEGRSLVFDMLTGRVASEEVLTQEGAR
jgi:hypothetical protein